MKLEIETVCYNERRMGKPWIAKVDFDGNTNGNFHWGDWVGKIGSAGLLMLDVEVGDVVAMGQMDNRKPRNSAPDWYIVVAEGGDSRHSPHLMKADKVDAFRQWRLMTATAKEVAS
jgi:hypothetical protein